MKIVTTLAILALTAISTGCAMTGSSSRTGHALVNLQKEAGEPTDNAVGSKEGKACSQNYLGLFATGDSTLVAAMEDGEITKPSTVDFSYTQFLGLYGEVCTHVTGE